MNTEQNNFDIIIVGGGLVGASLAVMLRHSGYRIAVIEAYQHDSDASPSYDDRTVALSHGSKVILENMGLWGELRGQLEAIKTIHISDRGHLGVTRLHHDEEGVEALGYVAENRVLGNVLFKHLQQQENLELLCPASLVSVEDIDGGVSVAISMDGDERVLQTRCLVAADGITSKVRQCLHIGSSDKFYRQSAVICNVTPGKRHDNVAYERFTDQGPVAFLPLTGNRCSVVWTLPSEEAESVSRMGDDDFLGLLQQRFGYRLGMLKQTGKRSVYPLALRESTQLVRGRTVVVGNAAHALHPVAGQGFNLALRDISTLVDCITDAGEALHDPGTSSSLERYQQQRAADTQRVYRFTDALIRVFSNDSFMLGHARAAGLLAVDLMPFIKHKLARQSMGIAGRLSSLGRM